MTVESAAEGPTGLDKALSGSFDLILLDVMLPGMDGFEICNRIRAEDPEQPIIMLTAKTSDEDIIQGLSLGADDYVAKPFSVAQLVLRVQAVLRRSRIGVQQDNHLRLGDEVELDIRNLSGRRGEEDAVLHPPGDGDPAVPGRQVTTAGVPGRTADQGLGLCEKPGSGDPHRRHPHRQAAAQDRSRPGRTPIPDHRAWRRLPPADGIACKRLTHRLGQKTATAMAGPVFSRPGDPHSDSDPSGLQ